MQENQMSKGKKAYQNPLSRHILIGCILFSVILCLGVGLISFSIFRNSLMAQYQSHLREIMQLTMARMDVEDLEQCMETGTESEPYRELIAFMDQVRQNGMLEYLVIIKPIKDGETYDVMQVASGLLAEERNGENKKDMAVPLLGDRIGEYYTQEFIALIYDDMHNREDIKFSASNTEFGKSYDGAMAIRNAQGESIALLTAGITLNEVDVVFGRYLVITMVGAVLFGVVFQVLPVLWLRRRVIVPLQKIEQTAGDFAERSHNQKDPGALVLERPDIHTGDELESLADTLVSMSENMQAYVEELLDSAVKMKGMEQEITKISSIALKDALTGVKNKAAYEQTKSRLEQEIAEGTAKFGILMIDLNFLKRVNDTFGHDKGDTYIRNLSRILCDTFAHSPVYRIGGDEFTVILQDRDLEACEMLMDSLREQLEALQDDGQLEDWKRVSAAMGLAIYDAGLDASVDDVFRRADKAMYANKTDMKAVRED